MLGTREPEGAYPTLTACWRAGERQSYYHIGKPKISIVKEITTSWPVLIKASEGFLGVGGGVCGNNL